MLALRGKNSRAALNCIADNMFTGIIEQLGKVVGIKQNNSNLTFEIKASFFDEIKIDQSIAHNGVCLTVDALFPSKKTYTVTAIKETLDLTNLSDISLNEDVNLERCMVMGGRLDGHIVQGHVDQIARLENIADLNGSWQFDFSFKPGKHVLIEKGSVTVNGTSLTCFNTEEHGKFSVAIIPYTFDHTVFHQLKIGDNINLEFDVIGKYVAKLNSLK